MKQWTQIRQRALAKGESKRGILRETGMHWRTLEKILTHSEPPGYQQAQSRNRPKIGAFESRIEQILKDDLQMPRKQRHTAQRIFERLRDEHGYDGCYSAVKEAVRRMRATCQEVFVPLKHVPGESTGERRRARRPGEVWSWDFVHDMTEQGSRFRMLTLIDEYTRQCLAIHPGWSIRARDVIAIVTQAMKREGQPECLRSDNGPKFVAYAVKDWLADLSIKTMYVTPGSPWEQGHIESFHDKFRDECLNRELFGSLAAARVIVGQWRKEYNQQRPHSSLSYRTPDEFAEHCNRRLQSGCALLPSLIAKDRDIKQPTNNPAELDF